MSNPDAVLSGGDKTLIRVGATEPLGKLYVVPKTIIATARLNQSVFVSPLAQLTVDTTSGWSDVRPGMTVLIGTSAGLGDVHVGRIRKTPGATTLYIGEMSPGDPGLVTSSTTKLFADNQYVTVLSDRNLWSMFPKLAYDGETATITKDFDVAFDGQTSDKKPPILNIGDHVAGDVDAISGVLTDSRAADLIAWNGETPVSYAWVGGTPTGATDEATYEAEYDSGHHIVSCTVEMSNGAIVTAERNIWADDGTVGLEVKVSGIRKGLSGATVSLELLSDFNAQLAQNAMCLLHFSASQIPSQITQVVGWVEGLAGDTNPITRGNTFSLISGLEILGKVTAYSQVLQYSADPQNWQESDLATVDWFVFYILKFHTNILNLFDFHLSGLTAYESNIWQVDRGNFLNQVSRALDGIDCAMTALPNGTIYIKRDPIMMQIAERAAVSERDTLTADDIQSASIEHVTRNKVGKVQGNAFISGTGDRTAVQSDGYGTVDGQGGITVSYNNMMVTDQSEMNFRTSLKLIRENNPYPRVQLNLGEGSYDYIEPALRYFIRVQVPADVAPEGVALDFRTVPTEISISFGEGGIRSISYTGVGETDANATPAVAIPIPDPRIQFDPITGMPILEFDSGMGWGLGLPSFPGAPPLLLPPVDLAAGAVETTFAILWNNTPTLLRTLDRNAGTVDWDDVFGLSGNLQSVIRMGGQRLTALTASKLYDILDAAGTPTVNDLGAFTGYKLLRRVAGIPGAFVAIGQDITVGAWSKTFDFTANDQDFVSPITPSEPEPSSGDWGTYSPGVGWLHGDGFNPDSVLWERKVSIQSFEFERCIVTSLSMLYNLISPDTATDGIGVHTIDKDQNRGYTGSSSPSAGTNQTFSASGTIDDVYYVTGGGGASADADDDNLVGSMTVKNFVQNGSGFNPHEDKTKALYSPDYGITIYEHEVGPATPAESGIGDGDDFGLGVFIVATNRRLYSCTNLITGDFLPIAGSIIGGYETDYYHTLLRVPYRLRGNSGINNVKTALRVIRGATDTAGGQTLWDMVINAVTRTILSSINITAVISGVPHYPIGAESFETFGNDGRRMEGAFKPVGGGTTKILENLGSGWSIKNTFDATFLRYAEPQIGGNGLKIFMAGNGGARFSIDHNATLLNKDGDVNAETGLSTVKGFIGL